MYGQFKIKTRDLRPLPVPRCTAVFFSVPVQNHVFFVQKLLTEICVKKHEPSFDLH